MNVYDMLMDENCDQDILLYSEKGEPIRFTQIAVIPLRGQVYAILQPVELEPGMEEDEALVFLVREDGEDSSLELCMEDEIIDQVFDAYYRLLAQWEEQGRE